MSDLETRLQAALGDAYRIERELGGAGMRCAFLAQPDSALASERVVAEPGVDDADPELQRLVAQARTARDRLGGDPRQ